MVCAGPQSLFFMSKKFTQTMKEASPTIPSPVEDTHQPTKENPCQQSPKEEENWLMTCVAIHTHG